MTVRILLVSQFSGVSPRYLEENPTPFDELVESVVEETPSAWEPRQRPKVMDVDDDYRPPWGTTAIRANHDGIAEAWRYNWDSSG